jgi:ABC-2 type transport system permease protein
MSLTRISAIILRQYYLTRDNPTRAIQIFLWPLLDIILWGFISKYIGEIGGEHFSLALLGAIILWDFLVRVMYGVTVTFFEDVWSRNFLNIFASPLAVGEYIIGMVLWSICTSLVGFGAMLLSAWLFFGFTAGVYTLLALPFMLILFFTGVALGILGVSIVLRYGPSAEWFIWPMPAVLTPFAGVFYPLSTLPEWMQTISHALPPSYVFEGLRSIIAGNGIASSSLLYGTLLGIFYIGLAYVFFLRVYRRAIRTGLIARYSAETVS